MIIDFRSRRGSDEDKLGAEVRAADRCEDFEDAGDGVADIEAALDGELRGTS